MKMQDAFLGRHASCLPAVCLRCDAAMKIKTIVPTLFALAVDDIVYVCPSCGIENNRTVRRAD
jgi:hypothetical protein